jgi:hypothetical protein
VAHTFGAGSAALAPERGRRLLPRSGVGGSCPGPGSAPLAPGRPRCPASISCRCPAQPDRNGRPARSELRLEARRRLKGSNPVANPCPGPARRPEQASRGASARTIAANRRMLSGTAGQTQDRGPPRWFARGDGTCAEPTSTPARKYPAAPGRWRVSSEWRRPGPGGRRSDPARSRPRRERRGRTNGTRSPDRWRRW